MFYVYTKKRNKYGVVDTDDGICEYYSERQLKNFHDKRISIYGVSDDGISIVDTNFIRAKAKLLGLDICNYILDRTLKYRVEQKDYSYYLVSCTGDEVELSNTKDSFVFNLCNNLKIENLWDNRYFNMDATKMNDAYMLSYGDYIETLYNRVIYAKDSLERRYKVTPRLDSIYRRGRTLIVGVKLSCPDTEYFEVSSFRVEKCHITDNCKLYKKYR